MTIRTRLSLNVLVGLLITTVVAVASIAGMTFVREQLVHLTEESGPFQVRTLELQSSLQAAIADVTRLGSAAGGEELAPARARVERSLAAVAESQRALQSLPGRESTDTFEQLRPVATELIDVTRARLDAEGAAVAASREVEEGLRDISKRLNALNEKIGALQEARRKVFITSVDETRSISTRLRAVEALHAAMKDLQLAILEIEHSREKKSTVIARGKANSAVRTAQRIAGELGLERLVGEIKAIAEKTEEMSKVRMASIGEASAELATRLEEVRRDLSERISIAVLAIEQDVASATERYERETSGQQAVTRDVGTATEVLSGTAHLLAIGLSIESLVTKLFTAASRDEVDRIERDLKTLFAQASATGSQLAASLTALAAKDELGLLEDSQGAVTTIGTLLFSTDGILARIRHRIDMRQTAVQATERLAAIATAQANEGQTAIAVARDEQEQAIASVEQTVQWSVLFVAAVGLGAVLLGTGLGIWVYRSIALPLRDLIGIAGHVAKGDLTCQIGIRGRDEIDTVKASMADMVRNLKDIVRRISVSTDSLGSSSRELSSTAVTLERGSRDQTVQIEQSASAMSQMSQATTEVARNVAHTAEMAQRMRASAAQGRSAMDLTAAELGRFAVAVKASADTVATLGRKSDNIGTFVTLIRDIAAQTNLLALNAAIEAARAGENGRGFAVVAENVRELAERTTAATEEIAAMVRAMQTESAQSVQHMQEEAASIATLLEQVNRTLQVIDGILADVEQVSERVQTIAAATEEQSCVAGTVCGNMDGVADVAHRLGDSITEINRASSNLMGLASELQGMTSWFRT